MLLRDEDGSGDGGEFFLAKEKSTSLEGKKSLRGA